MRLGFYIRTRHQALAALEAKGVARDDALEALAATTNAEIDKVAASIPEASAALGSIGDGTIIRAIMAFFESPQGQAIIDALVKLLLGFLGV